MKQWKKSMVALSVLGMTLTGAAGVYAGANLEKISAYLNHGISISVDGSIYDKGKDVTPITYKNSTYLPVRALADVLDVPLRYDPKYNQVIIGTPPGQGEVSERVSVKYSEAQLKQIKAAYAQFDGFKTPYVVNQMVKGDSYEKAAASSDGVNLIFKHMTVNVSPRDYSYSYDSQPVTLTNGVKAKWYTPDGTDMLTFKLDDRFVTISSPDHSLTKTQLEQVAVSVAQLK
ncbi:hypothetical protein JCM10914A_02110 [Paenibacillus sp. JCM 10914]|uniref:hypothetical protein n=1 Tax=Paenibacillus sp. JCM 10914 TaxID=1236974 RepID=UPI000565BA23|nr:hypothetical protein [Paenibacillus sp. JCM 10914]